MRVRYLQHVPFETPGAIADWASARGHSIVGTALFAGEKLPALEELDLLVILGGPMSVNDEAEFSWLVEEKAFVRAAIESGKPTLGICLGAQLIASACGAKVYPGPEKEIGWHALRVLADAKRSPLVSDWPETPLVFHWHGETFDLPTAARRFASTDVCENQAFVIGERCVGLQFHLEVTPANVREMAVHCANELAPGRYIQQGNTLVGREGDYESLRPLLFNLLDRLLKV